MSGESAQTLLMNRYRIIRQLGQGGMGSVWLAEDTQLDNKLFAVKMLPSVLVSNRRAYNQLKAEALVSMRLTHPNIVTLRAFEENNGNPFLVMDYIDGVTLDEYLADREFQGREKNDGRASATVSRGQEPGVSEEEVIRILKPVAEALDYAHGEGVVHRDVKPANVMIRKDGHPFVLDFGIAREIQETMTRVTGKMSSGTLLYMSPEQLAGEAPKAPQDVYSFAAMAYECLKGEPPFCRGAIEDQIRNKIPAALPANIAIASSVMAGLEKSPDKRPSACSDVIGAAKTLPADAAPVRRVASVPVRPVAFSPPVSKKPLDADVYLLEEDAKQLLQQKIDVIPASVCPELDEGLAKAKRTYRAALNAMSRGDASAAKQLFGEFLNYPATRGKSATEIARAAFMAEEWSKGMSVAPEADQKDADILFWMGYCSEMGYGCEKDGGAAIRYYRGSAGFGNETAKFNLAVKLETGSDCEKNVSEAISLFEELASIGAVDAQKHLADIYRVGEIVEKDLSKSFKWYQAAGSTGDAYSCRMVGWFYENGHGVGKDAAKAKDWYRVAAKSGDAEAKRNLARLVEAEETARKEEEKRRAEAVRKAEEERRAEAARKVEAAARLIRERREQKLRTIKEQWKKETEDYNAARARRRAAEKESGTEVPAPGVAKPVLLEPVSNGELSSVEENSKSGRIGVLAVMLAMLSAVLAAVWYWGWYDFAFVRGNGDVSACPPPKHESARPKNEISEKKDVKRKRADDSVMKHGMVQLWKSGPYWADRNIGAEKPEDYGYYFWWGDTVGYKKQNGKWVASDGSVSNLTFSKINTPTERKDITTLKVEGWITADGILAPEHDAARVHWGGDWRMPTRLEFDSLISKCDWIWTTRGGVGGYVVRGKGDYVSNSIFLPSISDGIWISYGRYWSSVPDSDDREAISLGFGSNNLGTGYGSRSRLQCVRPLRGFSR